MTITFLFAETLDEIGCTSIQLEPDNSVAAPLAHRTFDEIRTLQSNKPFIVVVLSAARTSLLEVELPWLSEVKARAAIPFALEEQLAQKVSALHFAFDKVFHHNNRYLVGVIERQYLAEVMTRLTEEDIVFNEITMDWFAL